MNHPLLTKVAEIRARAPAARRAILDLILEDPDRVLEESFEQLAERSRQLGADDHAHLPRPRLCRPARVQARAGAGAGARRLAAAPARQHRRRGRRGGRQDRAQRRGLGGRRAQPARHDGARCRGRRHRRSAAHRHLSAPATPRGSWPPTCRRGCSASACRPTPGPTTTCSRWRRGAQRPGRRGDRDHARRRHAVAARRGRHRARAGRQGDRDHAARHAAGASAPTSCSACRCPTTR